MGVEKKGREKIGTERKGKRRMKAGGWVDKMVNSD